MNSLKISDNVEDAIRQEIQLAKHEDPFYIINLKEILNQHQNWLLKMPRVKPFYAVKCNPSNIVIEILSALGVNFDCASKGEIDHVMSLNVKADRIIYANPCKNRSYISYARECGVDLMTFDSEMELKKVADLFPDSRLVLRIKVDDSSSLYKFSSKFGASIEEAFKLLSLAKKMGLNVVGVSFHVGSGCESAAAYERAIQDAKCVFDYGLKMGFNMHLLDIGGGFPGDSNLTAFFEEIANVVSQALNQEFPSNYVENLQIIAEPGRYYATSAFTLATQIMSKKIYAYDDEEITKNSESIRKDGLIMVKPNLIDDDEHQQLLTNVDEKRGVMYYLNDGTYGSFNCTTFDYIKVNLQPYYLNNEENMAKMSSLNFMKTTLWGPTCDSLDLIENNIYLPEMEIGDWIVFKDMGAYTICLGSTFNGFESPKIKYCTDSYTINTLKSLIACPRTNGEAMSVERQTNQTACKEMKLRMIISSEIK